MCHLGATIVYTWNSGAAMLCWVEKHVFEPDFATEKHPNTLLFTGSWWVSHGMIIVSRGWKIFDLLTEKGIPPRTECWENTLLPIPHASQSFDHGILLKINRNNKKKSLAQDFLFLPGEKSHSWYHKKAFSLPIFPQRWQHRGWSLQEEINPKSRLRELFSSLKYDLGDYISLPLL